MTHRRVGGRVSASNASRQQPEPVRHPPDAGRTATSARPPGQIRPRVEIVWARQELQRLTQQITEAELALKSLQSNGLSDASSEKAASERTLKSEIKRLTNRKRNLVRWLIGVGVKVTAKDKELARSKPRSSNDKASKKKPKKKSKTSSKSKKRTSTGKSKSAGKKGEKAVWSGPSHGGRRRVRFVS